MSRAFCALSVILMLGTCVSAQDTDASKLKADALAIAAKAVVSMKLCDNDECRASNAKASKIAGDAKRDVRVPHAPPRADLGSFTDSAGRTWYRCADGRYYDRPSVNRIAAPPDCPDGK